MSTGVTAYRSARVPSPGAMPADDATQTRRPSSVTPTPWTPGTYGRAGWPKYDVPEAQSRSSGTIGAAVIRTSTCPSAGVGSGWSAYDAGSPWACDDGGLHVAMSG